MIQRIEIPQTNPAIERFLNLCHRHRYPAKSTIITMGDKPDILYYIVSGSVSVVIENEAEEREIVLAYLNSGDFFGEMALLGDHVRKADVHAITACTLLRIRSQDVLKLGEEFHEITEQLNKAKEERKF